MFSGIISNLGTVNRIIRKNESAELTVHSSNEGIKELKDGESIAVNGACLTVRDSTEDTFTVDLSAETLNRTNFKDIQEQSLVNLERSLMPSDRISGHFVSGHIDCVGSIVSIEEKKGEMLFRFNHPAKYAPYIVEKGSVSIDGISLTAFSCFNNEFTVSIIPFTFMNTNMNIRKLKDAVNIECDMIGKYIYKACENILLSNDAYKSISKELLSRKVL